MKKFISILVFVLATGMHATEEIKEVDTLNHPIEEDTEQFDSRDSYYSQLWGQERLKNLRILR